MATKSQTGGRCAEAGGDGRLPGPVQVQVGRVHRPVHEALIERQAGWTGVPCTTVRWNPWRAIDVLRAHRAGARRASVGELDRHGAAVAAAEATLASNTTSVHVSGRSRRHGQHLRMRW